MENRQAQTHAVLIVTPLTCIDECHAALRHIQNLVRAPPSRLGCVAVREAKEDIGILRDHRLTLLLLVCKDYKGAVAPETMFEPS